MSKLSGNRFCLLEADAVGFSKELKTAVRACAGCFQKFKTTSTLANPANNRRGSTENQGIRRHVPRDDRARSHHGKFTDCFASEDDGPRSERCTLLNDSREEPITFAVSPRRLWQPWRPRVQVVGEDDLWPHKDAIRKGHTVPQLVPVLDGYIVADRS